MSLDVLKDRSLLALRPSRLCAKARSGRCHAFHTKIVRIFEGYHKGFDHIGKDDRLRGSLAPLFNTVKSKFLEEEIPIGANLALDITFLQRELKGEDMIATHTSLKVLAGALLKDERHATVRQKFVYGQQSLSSDFLEISSLTWWGKWWFHYSSMASRIRMSLRIIVEMDYMLVQSGYLLDQGKSGFFREARNQISPNGVRLGEEVATIGSLIRSGISTRDLSCNWPPSISKYDPDLFGTGKQATTGATMGQKLEFFLGSDWFEDLPEVQELELEQKLGFSSSKSNARGNILTFCNIDEQLGWKSLSLTFGNNCLS
ncbi:hypothetical protein Tco_0209515 [Tanacetum coccineum]